MKILIDTNIYLDFYRSNKETLQLFKELLDHVDKIILTDQIIDEFERSRERIIKEIQLKFEGESKLPNFSSSYLQGLEEFKDLIKIQDLSNQKRKEILSKISKMLLDSSADPVATYFREITNASRLKGSILPTTHEIIEKAQKRKQIGNPPTSEKYSIGDEINWEIVLKNICEDIVIVGRDKTYKDNFSFLKTEFYKETGFTIIKLTESITEALSEAGVKTSAELEKVEKETLNELISNND